MHSWAGPGCSKALKPHGHCSLQLLAWLWLAAAASFAQQATQFFPDDVPSLAANITERLIYRAGGLMQLWDDPYVAVVRLQVPIVLDQDSWRTAFNATGGVATIGPNNNRGGAFRITSGLNDTQQGGLYSRQTLDFSSMPAVILVQDGGRLLFDNVVLANIAPTYAYDYSLQAPWRNAGVGYPLWPTIMLESNATVVLRNVTVNYVDPSSVDTPEQYTAKVVFGLRQQYGSSNITEVNSTAATVVGPLRIPVLVLNGSTNDSRTGEDNAATITNSTVTAYAVLVNVTFNCEPRSSGAQGSRLSGGALAAAIAVPVVVVLLLLAGITAWLYTRRRRRSRQAAKPDHASAAAKDIELGNSQRQLGGDTGNMRDRFGHADQAAVYVPAGSAEGTPGSSSAGAPSSAGAGSSDRTGCSGATPAGTHTPLALASTRAAGQPSSSAESGLPFYAPAAGTAQPPAGVGGSKPSTAGYPGGSVAAAAAAAAFNPLEQTVLSPSQSSEHHSAWHNAGTASRSASGSAAGLADTSSVGTAGLERVSTGRLTPGNAALGGRPSMESPHPGGTPVAADAAAHAAHAAGLSGSLTSMQVGRRTAGSTAAGRDSGGSARSARSTHSGVLEGTSGSRGGAGGPEDTGSGGVLGSRSRDPSAVLRMRSELAVLRDLKIGPLLGRGSYGRVYKGRWKAVTVAVKIIEHSEGSPGTASSGGKRISVGREMFVATNISHPNVVQTYHISTMTISQRNALASTWLKEAAATSGGGSSSNAARLAAAAVGQIAGSPEEEDVESSGSSTTSQSSAEAQQREVLETWMLLEFCEKGSLQRAISQGKFIRRSDQQPDMIGIYKALLDTASGLDYLHSIGVVHGDLKAANVLLKGSARDIRGFACKIADFGLSRVLDMDATHISTRTYGTIVYMPAELLLSGRMTTATDIYSFGMLMWELFTSQPVFDEDLSIGQIFYMIAYQGWRPHVPPNCPPGYAQVMATCWHQDPEQRPTVQQLLRSLQRLYVTEKQRLLANKQAAATAAAAAAAAGQEAAAEGASTLVDVAAPAPAGGPAAAHAAAPMSREQQAAAGAAAAAAAAAALAAPAGVPPAAGTVEDQHGTPDRTSFESTTSDRYANAAAAATTAGSISAAGLQWKYPGQLAATATSVATAAPPFRATAERGSPSYSGSALVPAPVDAAAAPTAAAIAGAGVAPSAVAGSSEVATPEVVSTGSTYEPSRRSFGSSVESPTVASGGQGSGAQATGGSGGPLRSSGGTEGHEEYQPWANAVADQGPKHGTSRVSAVRQASAPLPGHWPGGRRRSFVIERQQQELQQEVRQRQNRLLQQQQQQQQVQVQQPQHEQPHQSRINVVLQQALTSHAVPGAPVGAYAPLYHIAEIQPEDDNEQIVDTIPSESLFPQQNASSSSSNAAHGSADDMAGQEYDDTSGFLAALRRAGPVQQHRRPAHRPVGPAAQGFVEAIEMVARQRTSSQSYYNPQPTMQLQQHTGEQQQQRQQQQLVGSAVLLQPGSTALPGVGSPTRLLADSGFGRASTAATIDTMPSVLADGSGGSGSSLANRSSGTTMGISRAGTQDSNWQPSSRGSAEGGLGPWSFSPPQSSQPLAALSQSRGAALPQAAPAVGHTVVSPFAHVASPFAAPVSVATAVPATGSTAGPASAAVSPFAAASLPSRMVATMEHTDPPGTGPTNGRLAPRVPMGRGSSSSGSGGSGSSRGSTPERERSTFLYRTPSGRVLVPPQSTGTLQTVREGSSSSAMESISSGTGTAGSGTAGSASKAQSTSTDGSRATSLHPAGSQESGHSQQRGGQQQQQQGQQWQHTGQQQQEQGQQWQMQQGQQQQQQAVFGPAPSPFAALAQRAGSLFGPP